MAWIKVVDEDEADAGLAAIYAEQVRLAGNVANIIKIHSTAPEILQAHLAIYSEVMHARGELSRVRREMIAVAVSAVNHCHY